MSVKEMEAEVRPVTEERTAGTTVPVAAVERSRAWIDGVTRALGEQGGEELARRVMACGGAACAAQLRAKIIAHHGRKPASVDEALEAINRRRVEVLGMTNLWRRQGNRLYFELDRCGCDLVEAGLAEPNPVYCLCSATMFEQLFAPFWEGTVRTEIMKAIGRGDATCEFVVHLQPVED
jgi:predicted ArsR family transcriptional regulator